MSTGEKATTSKGAVDALFEQEDDVLQAVEFAQADATLAMDTSALATVLDERWDELAQAEDETQFKRTESMSTVARRLALRQEFRDLARLAEVMPPMPPSIPPPALQAGDTKFAPAVAGDAGRSLRDSMVTVPPAIGSIPPVEMPAAPLVPSAAHFSADHTLPLPPLTPSLAETFVPRPERVWGRGTWALLAATVAIALPGGLLLGRALTAAPQAAATRAAAAAHAPSPGSEPPMTEASQGDDRVAARAANAPSAPPEQTSPTAAAPETEDSIVIRAPRPVHHGHSKKPATAPTPAASVAAPGLSLGAPSPNGGRDSPD